MNCYERCKQKNNHKISFRSIILALLIVASLVPVIVSFVINYKVSIDSTKKQFDVRINSEILKVDKVISTYFSALKNATKSYGEAEILKTLDSRATSYVDKQANTSDGKVKMDYNSFSSYEKELSDYIKAIQENNADLASVTVGVESNGGVTMYPYADRSAGYDSRTRSWYEICKNSENDVVMSDVYVSYGGQAWDNNIQSF